MKRLSASPSPSREMGVREATPNPSRPDTRWPYCTSAVAYHDVQILDITQHC